MDILHNVLPKLFYHAFNKQPHENPQPSFKRFDLSFSKLKAGITNRSKLVTCVDIDSNSITTVITQWNTHKKCKLLGFGKCKTDSIFRGTIVHTQKAAKALKASVKQAGKMAKKPVRNLIVGTNGSDTKIYQSHGVITIDDESITDLDVKRVLDNAATRPLPEGYCVIDTVAVKFSVDGCSNISDPVGRNGIRLEVEALVICGLTNNLNKIVDTLDMARKYRLDKITYKPLATCEILNNDEKEIGVLLVNIGSSCSDIVFFRDGSIHDGATFAFGSIDITKKISSSMGVSMNEAERVRTQYNAHSLSVNQNTDSTADSYTDIPVESDQKNTEYHPDVDEIIGQQLKQFFETLRPVIESYRNQAGLSAGIVLTGEVSELNGIDGIAASVFKLPVRFGTLKGLDNLDMLKHEESYSSAVGLSITEIKRLTRIDRMGRVEKCRHNISTWIEKVA